MKKRYNTSTSEVTANHQRLLCLLLKLAPIQPMENTSAFLELIGLIQSLKFITQKSRDYYKGKWRLCSNSRS